MKRLDRCPDCKMVDLCDCNSFIKEECSSAPLHSVRKVREVPKKALEGYVLAD